MLDEKYCMSKEDNLGLLPVLLEQASEQGCSQA